MRFAVTVNGDPVRRRIEPDATLLEVLRDDLDLTGTKWGCLTGDCGACTVLVDDEAIVACLQLACQLEGRAVTTIEGIGTGGLDDVQAAFVRHGAIQCGFCTPGMIVAVEALLATQTDVDEEDVREALAGNLCRCTGYNKVVDAVLDAAEQRRALVS
jgi:carbon-monoxide dehydrogenase small subunit